MKIAYLCFHLFLHYLVSSTLACSLAFSFWANSRTSVACKLSAYLGLSYSRARTSGVEGATAAMVLSSSTRTIFWMGLNRYEQSNESLNHLSCKSGDEVPYTFELCLWNNYKVLGRTYVIDQILIFSHDLQINSLKLQQCYFLDNFTHILSHSWSVPMMTITDFSHNSKWENLYNLWLMKSFFYCNDQLLNYLLSSLLPLCCTGGHFSALSVGGTSPGRCCGGATMGRDRSVLSGRDGCPHDPHAHTNHVWKAFL